MLPTQIDLSRDQLTLQPGHRLARLVARPDLRGYHNSTVTCGKCGISTISTNQICLISVCVSLPVGEDTVCLGHILALREQLLVRDLPL